MAKIFLIFVMIFSGCSAGTNYKYFFSQEFLPNEFPYHSIIYLQDNKHNIFLLKERTDNQFRWVAGSRTGFLTNKFKIIKTYGFQNNFEILDYPSLDEIINSLTSYPERHFYASSLIRFDNPPTKYLTINYVYKFSPNEENFTEIEESYEIPLLNWQGSNIYTLSDSNALVSFKGKLVPNMDKIKYKYFYPDN